MPQRTTTGDFRFLLNPPPPRLSRCSALLSGRTNGTGSDYRVSSYRTTLTIKAVMSGASYYRTARGHYRVTADSFLILNHGQEYSLEIDGRSQTETLCPFFERGLVEHVADCLVTRAERQLDEIEVREPTMGFYERLYPRKGRVDEVLRALHMGLRRGIASGPWLEDRFYALASALVGLQAEVQREVDGFPGLRRGTRAELYRRLHRGRDYLVSCYDQPLTVAMAARVANLSPYHFHRMFKRAFGETPMQLLQARRLDAACRLLSGTDRPVTAICFDVGFESLGSFSWLFRRRFGLSPRQFRAVGCSRRNTLD